VLTNYFTGVIHQFVRKGYNVSHVFLLHNARESTRFKSKFKCFSVGEVNSLPVYGYVL